MKIILNNVMKAVDKGIAKANSIGSPSSIAVVDAGRNLLGFARMDGALLASVEISQGKAYTARSMNMRTSELTDLAQPGAPLFGLETSHHRPLIVFGGGVPVSVDGEVVGAVGVAGGTVDQDEEVALEVVRALES